MDKLKELVDSFQTNEQAYSQLLPILNSKMKYLSEQLSIILNNTSSSGSTSIEIGSTNPNRNDNFKIIVDQVRYISQKYLLIFKQETILTYLKVFLRTSSYQVNRKISIGKKNISSLTGILAADILYRIYRNDNEWPIDFLLLYLDDSLGSRQWVDSENNLNLFVQNIIFSPFIINNEKEVLQNEKK